MNKTMKALYKVMAKDVPIDYPNGLGCTLKVTISLDGSKDISFGPVKTHQTIFIKRKFEYRYYVRSIGSYYGSNIPGVPGFNLPGIF